jgi:hypothetical protein
MKIAHVAVAAALLATSTAAAAQSATDARCILLSSVFAKQGNDAQAKKVAEDSLYFYLGRIAGQPTTAQMKTVMDAQAKTLTDANAGTLMGECVKAVQAKVQLLQTVAAQSQPAKPAQPQGR